MGELRARSPSSAAQHAARADRTRGCWPPKAPTSSPSTSAPTSTPTTTRWPGLKTSTRPLAWSKKKASAPMPPSPTSATGHAVAQAIDAGVAEFGKLDIVVANAGIAPLTKGGPRQAFVDAVDVDLVGVLNLVHASLQHLTAGASIIATGSLAASLASQNTSGMDAGPGGAGYGFAKQVVAHYVNNLALQLAPGIHPGQRRASRPTSIPPCCTARRCTPRSGRTWRTRRARTRN